MIMSLIFDKGKLREGLSVYEWVSGFGGGGGYHCSVIRVFINVYFSFP
jgi:hypothetical protein